MKRKNIILFFKNNGILLLKNKKILNYELKSVYNYKVINNNLFIKELNKINKQNNINTHILTDNIKILIDSSYTDNEINNLEIIFKDLSFNNITFHNWLNDIYSTKYLLLNISQDSIIIYYYTKIYHLPVLLERYETIVPYILILRQRYNIDAIRIFGTYEKIYDIREYIEEKININTYVYSNPHIFPISLYV